MDYGNLLQPTASSQKKGPNTAFHPHHVSVTKPRSIPPTGEPTRMKPAPSNRLDLDRHVTHGKFSRWDGQSSMPVKANNSWWQGEAAGLEGSVQEQRRMRGSQSGVGSKNARQAEREKRELLLTKDRFGNDLKDAVKAGGFEPERRPNATEARIKNRGDKYDSTRIHNPSKEVSARATFVNDCTDVIHRNWFNRYAVPPQAKDADAVKKMLEQDAHLGGGDNLQQQQQQSASACASSASADTFGTYRVLPPLKEVEKVYHMNKGAAGGVQRFASPYAKNERSAREGYIGNDNFVGRTTPIGERETASKAPPLSCLSLATADAKRGGDDSNIEHVPSFAQSRSVTVTRKSVTAQEDAEAVESAARSLRKRRAADASLVRLQGCARPGRVTATAPFSAIPQAALNLIPSAGH